MRTRPAVTGTIGTLLAASSAPGPLYPVYQADLGLSALTLTVIFAVYVLSRLASLLTVARLSDYRGAGHSALLTCRPDAVLRHCQETEASASRRRRAR